jgi:antagonist of KipI
VTLRVLHPGLLTTIQDAGRPAAQALGVSAGGAMDPQALAVANLLVGNAPDAAGLECTLTGPTLALTAPALVALAGADPGAAIDGRPLPPGRPAWIPAGATLHLGHARRGARPYLAVAGGLDVPVVLGSRATDLRAGFGGHHGRALARDDVLAVGEPGTLSEFIAASLHGGRSDVAQVARWYVGAGLHLHDISAEAAPVTLRLLEDEHLPDLEPASRQALFAATFRVSARSDRMGFRLDGPPLRLAVPRELLSAGVALGTLQLPPGGAPIVLMADRQTTGGYPRLGTVAAADLGALAQLRPGDRLRFAPVSLEEAEELLAARARSLATLARGIHHRIRQPSP